MSFLLGLPILLLILLAIVALVIHFLPAFVAWNRHVDNFVWILLINIFFGWPLSGWVIALVWAMSDTPRYGRVR
jgi:hypothetical protein